MNNTYPTLTLLLISLMIFGCNTIDNGSLTQEMKELRADNKLIVNSDNEEVLLKGVNVGQWLIMEGFMSGSNGNMKQVDMKRKLFDSGLQPEAIEVLFQKTFWTVVWNMVNKI